VLVLRWFRDGTSPRRLAVDAGISCATGYRYVAESIALLAGQAPQLTDVLAERLAAGDTHVILDGTLIRTTRVAGKVKKTKGANAGMMVHRWYSGKHRAFGGNIQFLATADGHPLWCSDVLPGSRNDLDAARTHGIVGALCAAAARSLPTLADKAYHAAGIGIRTPIKAAPGGHRLHGKPMAPDDQCHNMLHTGLRALGVGAHENHHLILIALT
jgi:hypothetical protein